MALYEASALVAEINSLANQLQITIPGLRECDRVIECASRAGDFRVRQ